MGIDRELTETMLAMARDAGACAAGVATVETLEGGPPSADLTYVLPEAKSAITFALPLDVAKLEQYLKKESHERHVRDNLDTNVASFGLAAALAAELNERGHPSLGISPNLVWRKDVPGGARTMQPDISHRYLAVAAGVGWFGFSGNVITSTHGASVILGSTVTTAELEATEPLDPEDRYCDDCHLCLASCNSKLMSKEETTTVTLGKNEFSHSARRNYHRCDLVCGGFTGLSKSGKWSTWSPGRFPVPDDDEEFEGALTEAISASLPRPEWQVGFSQPLLPGRKLSLTCGNCQLICHPDKDERRRRYRMLTTGGVVIQHRDGSVEAVTPAEAERHLASLTPEERATYE